MSLRTFRVLIIGVALAFSAAGHASSAADKTVTIETRLTPKTIYPRIPSQLIVTVNGPSLAGLVLRFSATRSFHVHPVSQAWSAQAANTTVVCLADVTADDPQSNLVTGAIMISASLPQDGTQKQVASEIVEFEFQPSVAPNLYFLLGGIGIALGYIVRMLILALNATSPPQDTALSAAVPPVGLRKFVLKHYYGVDFTVTLTVGLLALAALMKDGRVPASANFWYSAILLGVGLGLLTNSDLLTRVHVG